MSPLAVVAGASSGIGLELARQFSANGFDLVVAAEVLAADPVGLVVDLAQPVADALDAGVDEVLDDGAAALGIALEDARLADGALPLGQALVVGQRVEARLGRRGDLVGVAVAIGGHEPGSTRGRPRP